MLKDKSNLHVYLAALEGWARLSGTPRKNQADLVMWHASHSYPKLYAELVKKFSNQLVGKTDGLQTLTAFFNERFGLSRQADLMNKFNQFLNLQREKGQDLISFIVQYESSYSELTKLGETFSYNMM